MGINHQLSVSFSFRTRSLIRTILRNARPGVTAGMAQQRCLPAQRSLHKRINFGALRMREFFGVVFETINNQSTIQLKATTVLSKLKSGSKATCNLVKVSKNAFCLRCKTIHVFLKHGKCLM